MNLVINIQREDRKQNENGQEDESVDLESLTSCSLAAAAAASSIQLKCLL